MALVVSVGTVTCPVVVGPADEAGTGGSGLLVVITWALLVLMWLLTACLHDSLDSLHHRELSSACSFLLPFLFLLSFGSLALLGVVGMVLQVSESLLCPSYARGLYRSGDGGQEPLEEVGTKLLFPRCLVGAVCRFQQSSMIAVGDHESVEKLINWFIWLLFARSYLGGVKVQRERCTHGCDQVSQCSPVGVVILM